MEQVETDGTSGNRWNKWNLSIYIVCAVAVLICLLAYGNAKIAVAQVNTYYQEQFELHCTTGFKPQAYVFNDSAPIFDVENWRN